MPNTPFLSLKVGNQDIDLGDHQDDLGFRISYQLETPEDFMSKQGIDPQGITLPATKNNDKIFNTFHNPSVEDEAPNGQIAAITGSGGGTGYSPGDSFTILGTRGTFARGTITSVAGGGVPTGVSLVYEGTSYPEGNSTQQTSADTGTGLGVSITALASASFRELMPCTFSVNGSVPVFSGYCLLEDAEMTDKPETYNINLISANGQWVTDLQNVTMWDCVNPLTHTFTVANVENTWTHFDVAGDGSDDYVYAPVRYRQPFDGTTLGYQGDNCVNIYHLRPSISLYWLIRRAFNSVGYTISSQFFDTAYFRGLVLPWVWGDFYDIDSQLVQGVTFKAVGELPSTTEPPPVNGLNPAPPYQAIPFWSGVGSGTSSSSAGGSAWNYSAVTSGWNHSAYNPATGVAGLTVLNGTTTYANGILPTGGVYVYNGSGTSGGGLDHFNMTINTPPNGYDNFMLYSFDATTGTMIYDFNPPNAIVSYTNISATFIISIYAILNCLASGQAVLAVECTQLTALGVTNVYTQSILPSGGAVVGPSIYPTGGGYPTTPTACSFVIPNMNPGDQLRFRLRCLADGAGSQFAIYQAGYLNNNPEVIGVPSYAYNPITQQFGFITPNAIWSPLQSSLNMTGFLIQLGNTVSFKNYDAFRNFAILDLLGGVVDLFNLEIQTDNINQQVTIEPMFGSTLPTTEVIEGYFDTVGILDYTTKRDISRGKGNKMSLFNGSERQIDLTFKLDGNDGAQNMWAQRNRNVYLGNVTYTGGINSNNINIDNGIIAGVPGSARYMLPNRFAKGNKQLTNRFFSSTIHCTFPQWAGVNSVFPSSPPPQLICIFSESANSSDAISQSFTPKLAFYAGFGFTNVIGAWIWIGDPAAPYPQTGGGNSSSRQLPYMFAVDYKASGNYPILSYCDENIGGAQVSGLMSQFYLQRFAIMRNGQLYTANLRLNLNDVCNWEHRQCISIDGSLYALIEIDGYDPLTDDSTSCVMWKVVLPQQIDIENSYPSSNSILSGTPRNSLTSYDLKYAQLLVFPSDLPQIS